MDRQTLSVRFKEPEVLFAQGEAEVRPAFKNILNDFFPRYIQILRRPKYINDIAEIRIEDTPQASGKQVRVPKTPISTTWNFRRGEPEAFSNMFFNFYRHKSNKIENGSETI